MIVPYNTKPNVNPMLSLKYYNLPVGINTPRVRSS